MADDQATVVYRPIPDFPGYRVGDDGSVWSCRPINGRGPLTARWRRMKPNPTTSGRLQVDLQAGGAAHKMFVHRLVLLAFVGPCPNGMEACHFPDRDVTNNRLSNLRWDTKQANAADATTHGTFARGERQGSAKATAEVVRAIRDEYATGDISQAALATKYGLGQSTVSKYVRREDWKHIA